MGTFDWQHFISAFLILFAIMNIPGAIPVIIKLHKQGKIIKPFKAFITTIVICVAFYYGGEAFLRLFDVDFSSFAIAGSIIIFIISIGMILDLSPTSKEDDEKCSKDATIVPIVFPLIVDAGTLTTLLSIRAEYHTINIFPAVLANAILIYIAIKGAKKIEDFLGVNAISLMQRFFGIILLTISVKLFTTNLVRLIQSIELT